MEKIEADILKVAKKRNENESSYIKDKTSRAKNKDVPTKILKRHARTNSS